MKTFYAMGRPGFGEASSVNGIYIQVDNAGSIYRVEVPDTPSATSKTLITFIGRLPLPFDITGTLLPRPPGSNPFLPAPGTPVDPDTQTIVPGSWQWDGLAVIKDPGASIPEERSRMFVAMATGDAFALGSSVPGGINIFSFPPNIVSAAAGGHFGPIINLPLDAKGSQTGGLRYEATLPFLGSSVRMTQSKGASLGNAALGVPPTGCILMAVGNASVCFVDKVTGEVFGEPGPTRQPRLDNCPNGLFRYDLATKKLYFVGQLKGAGKNPDPDNSFQFNIFQDAIALDPLHQTHLYAEAFVLADSSDITSGFFTTCLVTGNFVNTNGIDQQFIWQPIPSLNLGNSGISFDRASVSGQTPHLHSMDGADGTIRRFGQVSATPGTGPFFFDPTNPEPIPSNNPLINGIASLSYKE
jgi:hypothetical protein